MKPGDVVDAARLIGRAMTFEELARSARTAGRVGVHLAARVHSTFGHTKAEEEISEADAETLAVAFETIAKRLRGEAAALLVGPVEVGQ